MAGLTLYGGSCWHVQPGRLARHDDKYDRGRPSPGQPGGPSLWSACLVGCTGSLQEKVVGVAAKRLQPLPLPLTIWAQQLLKAYAHLLVPADDYVPTVQTVEHCLWRCPNLDVPSVVLHPHSRPTPRKCWRTLGTPARANNNVAKIVIVQPHYYCV